jgi:hypothetical protein
VAAEHLLWRARGGCRAGALVVGSDAVIFGGQDGQSGAGGGVLEVLTEAGHGGLGGVAV